MRIFVSYTTRNGDINLAVLNNIHEKISGLGTIFIDLLHNYGGGQRKVIDELRVSDLLLVLDSEKVLESEWVKFEIDFAKSSGIPIVTLTPEELLTKSEENIRIFLIQNFENIFCTSANSVFSK